MKNGYFMKIFKTKGNGLTRVNLNCLPQKWNFMEKSYGMCMVGSQ